MNVLDHPALSQGSVIAAQMSEQYGASYDSAVPLLPLSLSATLRRETIELEMDAGGVLYQRCGGGRRVIRKRIGD